MSILFIFFIIPFLIIFFLFIIMEVVLIPIIFLFASILALILFSGVYFWIFLALALAALMYLVLHLSNLVCKKFEDKKVIKFITIMVIVFIILGLIQKKLIHTEVLFINKDTGEQHVILENFIN